jgi:hypothetical protein
MKASLELHSSTPWPPNFPTDRVRLISHRRHTKNCDKTAKMSLDIRKRLYVSPTRCMEV